MSVPAARLLAVSDLHVGYPENRDIVRNMHPESPGDWLIVCGDVAEMVADVEWALGLLRERFDTVLWVPGNHELWTHPKDEVQLRGVPRYEHLVAVCRRLGVLTPEDEFPVFDGEGGPVRVAPLFVLYDYTFRAPGTHTKEESLAYAEDTGVVCADEVFLHPEPYSSRDEWCRARVAESQRRLDAPGDDMPYVLVNHWPLVREPTRVLRYPEFAQWCGTVLTADWHTRYRTAAVVYGHLHIPRSTKYAGVPFEEVSLGYPREWRPRARGAYQPRPVLGGRP
ncbi:MAG TPA: metallophosphoesterase [Pseudonocardia sp.]|nr:metallophosphoesterase [Pseudonocardia sp.]